MINQGSIQIVKVQDTDLRYINKTRKNVHRLYIGRKNGYYSLSESLLSNPHKMKTRRDREEVVLQYRQTLWRQINTDEKIRNELKRLARLVRSGTNIELVCWCAPKLCHGHIIRAAILWMATQLEV